MATVPRNQEELELLLVEQLKLLRKACGNDNDWDFTEGHNVVIRLRVLLQETNRSHSLLSQVDLRSGNFLHSIGPGNTLVVASTSGFWPRFLVPYEPWSESNCIDFEDWWENTEITVSRYRSSRRELVSMLANQEGGAHVDPNLKAGLAELKRGGTGWHTFDGDGNSSPMQGCEIATVRAIGFELLWSLEKAHSVLLNKLREKYGDFVDDRTFMRNTHIENVEE